MQDPILTTLIDKLQGSAERQAQRAQIADEDVNLAEGLSSQKRRFQQQDQDLRHQFARYIFYLLLGWVSSIVAFALLQGLSRCHHSSYFLIRMLPCSFSLPEHVIIALFASVTLSVVGLFSIVAKWLFSTQSDKNN